MVINLRCFLCCVWLSPSYEFLPFFGDLSIFFPPFLSFTPSPTPRIATVFNFVSANSQPVPIVIHLYNHSLTHKGDATTVPGQVREMG